MVRGLSVNEIARSLDPPVDERTVRRDITRIRRVNASWWRENSRMKSRMMRYLKERFDAVHEVIREAWLIVYESKDDLRMRVSGLNVVLGAEKVLNDLLGFSGVTLTTMELQEKVEQVDKEIAELRRLAEVADGNTINP